MSQDYLISNVYNSNVFLKNLLRKLNISSFHNLNKAKFANAIKMEHDNVQKLVSGTTKNPGIKTIMAVAQGLRCSIDELVGNSTSCHDTQLVSKDLNFNKELLNKVLDYVFSYINRNRLTLQMGKVFKVVDNIYDYNERRKHIKLDESHANWILQETFQKKETDW